MTACWIYFANKAKVALHGTLTTMTQGRGDMTKQFAIPRHWSFRYYRTRHTIRLGAKRNLLYVSSSRHISARIGHRPYEILTKLGLSLRVRHRPCPTRGHTRPDTSRVLIRNITCRSHTISWPYNDEYKNICRCCAMRNEQSIHFAATCARTH